jgi:hypothetical protein
MTTQAARRLTLNDTLVIDVDVHAHDTPEALAPYADPEWREVLTNLGAAERRYLDLPGYSFLSTPRLLGTGGPPPRGDSRIDIVWTAEQMRAELDAFAIDVGIVFPDYLLRLAALPNVAYARALTAAFNRWLAEKWLADDNLPVLLHAVSSLSSGFPYNLELFSTSVPIHTVGHVFSMMANLMSLMETGVPVRFPGLRICFCESGLSWVPFLRMRLDKEFTEYRYQWPHFNDRPSKWIREFYFATQPVEEPENRADLADIIRIYGGEETTVFASDWPHHDFDHPRAVFDLPVSDLAKRKMMGANALKMMPRVKVPAKYAGVYRQGETL